MTPASFPFVVAAALVIVAAAVVIVVPSLIISFPATAAAAAASAVHLVVVNDDDDVDNDAGGGGGAATVRTTPVAFVSPMQSAATSLSEAINRPTATAYFSLLPSSLSTLYMEKKQTIEIIN